MSWKGAAVTAKQQDLGVELRRAFDEQNPGATATDRNEFELAMIDVTQRVAAMQRTPDTVFNASVTGPAGGDPVIISLSADLPDA